MCALCGRHLLCSWRSALHAAAYCHTIHISCVLCKCVRISILNILCVPFIYGITLYIRDNAAHLLLNGIALCDCDHIAVPKRLRASGWSSGWRMQCLRCRLLLKARRALRTVQIGYLRRALCLVCMHTVPTGPGQQHSGWRRSSYVPHMFAGLLQCRRHCLPALRSRLIRHVIRCRLCRKLLELLRSARCLRERLLRVRVRGRLLRDELEFGQPDLHSLHYCWSRPARYCALHLDV